MRVRCRGLPRLTPKGEKYDPLHDVRPEHAEMYRQSALGAIVTGSLVGHDGTTPAMMKYAGISDHDQRRDAIALERSRTHPQHPIAGRVDKAEYGDDGALYLEFEFNGENPMLEKLVASKTLTQCSINDIRDADGIIPPRIDEISFTLEGKRENCTVEIMSDTKEETPASDKTEITPEQLKIALSHVPDEHRDTVRGVLDMLRGEADMTAEELAKSKIMLSELQTNLETAEKRASEAEKGALAATHQATSMVSDIVDQLRENQMFSEEGASTFKSLIDGATPETLPKLKLIAAECSIFSSRAKRPAEADSFEDRILKSRRIESSKTTEPAIPGSRYTAGDILAGLRLHQ